MNKKSTVPEANYVLHCDYCGFHSVFKGNEETGLTEVKLAPIPGGVPHLDPVKQEAVKKDSLQRRRMFKCKKCGRGIVVKKSNLRVATHKTEEDLNHGKQEYGNDKGHQGGLAGFDFSSNPSPGTDR